MSYFVAWDGKTYAAQVSMSGVTTKILLFALGLACLSCSQANDPLAGPAVIEETVSASTETSLEAVETTTTATPTTTAPTTTIVTMPSGDPVFDGYPSIVQNSSLDYRVESWFALSDTNQGQSVALAPGVYAPYNPNVRDLWRYYGVTADGDCVMIRTYFPNVAGACWDGVLAGDQEPAG